MDERGKEQGMLSVEQIVKENEEELKKLSEKALLAVITAALNVTVEMLKEELDEAIRDYEERAA